MSTTSKKIGRFVVMILIAPFIRNKKTKKILKLLGHDYLLVADLDWNLKNS